MLVPSSSLNCLAGSVTIIMLIGECGKYNVLSSSPVCTTPPSSFHIHLTIPIPEGLLVLPKIVATIHTFVSLKVMNMSLLLKIWVFAELSQTKKLESVSNTLLPF